MFYKVEYSRLLSVRGLALARMSAAREAAA